MLFTLKNAEGYIYSYMEWDVVNQFGVPVKNGDNLYIRDIWVHPKYNGRNVIEEYICLLDMNECTKHVEIIYWQREITVDGKKIKRMSKGFKRSTCLRRVAKLMLV